MTDGQFTEGKEQQISNELKCTGCGAILQFLPGTHSLVCQYCGAENAIHVAPEKIEEIDYLSFIQNKLNQEEKINVVTVKCEPCGASVTLLPNVTADKCPYCASNIVVKTGSTSTQLKPKSLLPFVIDKNKSTESFRKWIHSRWFAPSDLKEKADKGKLEGIYIPYWTYDTNTQSQYTGERGDYYYITETYTTQENGRTVTKTRQVRKIRWTRVSGLVHNNFDDILVIASNSLPKKYSERLQPWNLSSLVPYNDKFLSGFRSESYQVNITTGFDEAKIKMEPTIHATIRRDIGGDEQRINTVHTIYNDITFKHILLPIWISSYRYREKVFRFLVNGQTGQVQGERPYSWFKITLAIFITVAVIVAAILIFSK